MSPASPGTLVALAAAAALGLSACGGAAPAPRTGAAVFAQDCAGCHGLSGREGPRLVGGDLLHVQATRAELLEFTREMPVRRRLDAEELHAVVDYVLRVQRSGRPAG